MKCETVGTKNDRKGGIRAVFVLAKYQLELGVPEQGGISANPISTSRAFGNMHIYVSPNCADAGI